MEPIYDRKGKTVAWLRGKDIFSLNGKHAAVVSGENVYSHRGKQLGIYKKGFFRDLRGGAVAFTKGATGGPVLPVTAVPPVPPVPSVPPVPAVPAVPNVPAVPKLGWGIEWGQFINA